MYIGWKINYRGSLDSSKKFISCHISMEIKLNQKDYKSLLRSVAISNYVYWVMSDMVSAKYDEDIKAYESLTDKLLTYNENPKIESKYTWKKEFSDIYMDEIGEDMFQFEDYIFDDLLIRNMANKIMLDKIIKTGFQKNKTDQEVLHEVFKIEEKLRNDYEENKLKNFEYVGKL